MLLFDLSENHNISEEEISMALKFRGLINSINQQNQEDLLKAWLHITEEKSLPISLILFSYVK